MKTLKNILDLNIRTIANKWTIMFNFTLVDLGNGGFKRVFRYSGIGKG